MVFAADAAARRDSAQPGASGAVAGHAWFMDAPGKLDRRDVTFTAPQPGQALVEVIACGLCHTDLGFFDGSVRTKHALPLTLGHEVVGTVVALGDGADPLLQGATVVVPAVLPCGQCLYCDAGRSNACPDQKMPGNDIQGGFATHLEVPAGALVPVDANAFAGRVWPLAVVADAVSTAWQAVRRAELGPMQVAVVVGAGGVGGFVCQVARARGAVALALDVDPARLETLDKLGIETLNVAGRDAKDVRKDVHGWLGKAGVTTLHLKIFECSGTVAGQALAFGLLGRCATLLQVGFAAKPLELRFSNLMAFDATVHGTWGCPPSAYPQVLKWVADRDVRLDPFVELAPMSQLDRWLGDMAAHRLTKRLVLDPKQ